MEEKELRLELDMLRDKMKLSQIQFAEEYHKSGGNGTLSAKKAGYSEKSSHSQASRLLKDDKIKKYISILQQLSSKHFEVDREDVINKLTQIAFGGEHPVGQQMEAIKILNNMTGWNAPSKQEVLHTMDELAERTKDMSLDELKAYRQQYGLDIEQ